MKTVKICYCIALVLLLSSFGPKGFSQPTKNLFDVNQLKLTWGVIENHHNQLSQSLTQLNFTNTGKTIIPAQGWSLFFNFSRLIDEESPQNASIRQINGDLFKLSIQQDIKPGETLAVDFISSAWVVNFTDAPGGLYVIFDQNPTQGVSVKNYTINPSTEPKQYLRSPDDKIGLITPEILFNSNENIQNIPAEQLPKIFPTPVKYAETGGYFVLDHQMNIVANPTFSKQAEALKKELSGLLTKPIQGYAASGKKINLQQKPMAAEAYELQIGDQEIMITAADAAGIFYGIQSLKSLIPPASWAKANASISVPKVDVADAPRFSYRGFMLDVARNFQTKNEVLRLLDLMALYKLNVFHFHFNDDEGWRIEIPSLPELTEIGGKRSHTLDSKNNLPPSVGSGADGSLTYGSGYYTKADFIEILKYAHDRHIRVIPEIETPGHARAAIKAMDVRYARLMKAGKPEDAKRYLLRDTTDQSVYRSVQYWNDNVMDVSLPSTYNFAEKIIEELSDMYKEAGAPLTTIHFGGDEVPAGAWEKSPSCLALMQQNPAIQSANDLWYYYFDKINKLLKKKGLYLSGWEEIAMRKTMLDGKADMIPNPDFVNENFHVNVWNNVLGWGSEDLAYKLANAGYKVILSCVSNFYFDMAYYKDFNEPGYYWGSFVDVDKPFYFIPFDYFKNAKEDKMGGPLNKSIFVGKQRLTDYGKNNIAGIQGQLWSETVHGPERMEYMILPKLLGLAERAWAKDPEWALEKDSLKSEQLYQQAWSVFANVLGKRELPRLDYYNKGYQYRIPSAGANSINHTIQVNNQLPGFTIRYTSDGKEPDLKSKIYQSPITDKGLIKIKVFSRNGRSGRTTEIKND